MTQRLAWTRREVWTRKLIYPGHTFPTAAAPTVVAIGLALHDRVFATLPVLLAFLAGWLIQFAGVVTDNYSNRLRQPDDREHPELVQAIKNGILSLRDLRTTIIASYALATMLGLVLFVMAGWPVIAIGLFSMLASWAYSAGPWPFGRHGFADPLFFLFFGTVSVLGAYYVQAAVVLGAGHWHEALPLAAVAVSLPIGALITNILVIDDIRDCDFDTIKGKNTIAVRLGKFYSRCEFVGLLVFTYVSPFWFWRGFGFSVWVLLPLATFPLAIVVAHVVWTRDRFIELVPMTPRLAMLTVAYSICLAFGLAA